MYFYFCLHVGLAVCTPQRSKVHPYPTPDPHSVLCFIIAENQSTDGGLGGAITFSASKVHDTTIEQHRQSREHIIAAGNVDERHSLEMAAIKSDSSAAVILFVCPADVC